jgi:Domain of unknown function (DUF5666)
MRSKIHSFIKSAIPQSPKARAVGALGLSVMLALVIFQAGIEVGYKKASFSRSLGNNFSRVFEGPKAASAPYEGIPGGHGATGAIASVSSSTMVIIGPDKVEKIVIMDGSTEIRKFRDTIASKDLRVGDMVIALGTPDGDGKIVARLVRVLPTSSSTARILK